MRTDDQNRILYDGELRMYEGVHLPHWDVDDGIYFVTFRLHDSIPKSEIRRLSRAYHGIVSELRDDPDAEPEDVASSAFEFYLNRVDRVLDAGRGACHLRDERVAEMVSDSLKHFDGERYELLGWVIMPNHVHVVFRKSAEFSLAKVVGGWKSYTAHRAREFVAFDDHFWQPDYFDRLVRTTRELRDTLQYVWNNPEQAGLEEWEWKGLGDFSRNRDGFAP